MKYHYVYRITNINERKHYYGVRSSSVKPVYDLGVKYFSSSKDSGFIRAQRENPRLFRYKVIRCYNSRSEAVAAEIKLHNKFNVHVNESFYNRCKQTAVGWDTTGNEVTKDTRVKISNGLARVGHPKGMLGKKHSLETRNKIKHSCRVKARQRSYPVYQYTLDGEFIREFEYIGAVKVFFGLNSALANVIKAIKYPHRKYKDSLWRLEKYNKIGG